MVGGMEQRVTSNSKSRRQRNHELPKSGIPKRKKTDTHPRLSCKIDYLLNSNHSDASITSEFFTDDQVDMDPQPAEPSCQRRLRSALGHTRRFWHVRICPLKGNLAAVTPP